MTTTKSKLIRTAGVAMLLLASALTPHAATAQAPRASNQLRVAFAYNRSDSAEAIYAHLQAKARDACVHHGSRSLRQLAYENVCTRDLVSKAVEQIGRADLVDLDAGGAAPLTLAAR